jgi:hypothetical protein
LTLRSWGVKRQQFAHTSAVHGPEHVNRVIYLAMTIARLQGFASLMPEVWASAYLHDLARTRDGVCHEHGRHAISLIPQYTELLHRAGVRDIQAVAHAIDVHARPVRAQHPVAAILKDADSLDRVRIGDFDPRFLHLERSHSIAPLAHKLWLATDGQDDWMTIWDAAVRIFNPHSGIASRTPGDWNEHESGRERMLRRLRQGEHPNQFDKIARLVPSEICRTSTSPRRYTCGPNLGPKCRPADVPVLLGTS